MASDTAVGSNVEIVREYTRRVFNAHDPDLASEYVTPDVRWHGGTLGTALEAWVKQALPFELGHGGRIIGKVLALPPHRLLPRNPKPAQILVDRFLVVRAATRGVDVLDTEQQPSAVFARHVVIEQCGIGMAQMEVAIGAWRKTKNAAVHRRNASRHRHASPSNYI